MPCGGRIDTNRPRSAGVLSKTELSFCRANGIALSYDPVQIGWVLACAVDDIDTPPHPKRPGWPEAAHTPVAGVHAVRVRDAQYQLRAWHENDVAAYLALLDDPEVWAWLPETYPGPLTAETAALLIDISNASNHHHVSAVLRNSEIVGQVRLQYDVDAQDASVAEISYWLGRAHWGKGIGSDIVRMFTLHSYTNNPGIWSIIARVHGKNAGSLRILEKAGYRFERADPKDPAWTLLRCRRA